MLKAKRVDTGRYTLSLDGKQYELVLDDNKQWKIVVITRQAVRERFTKKKDAMAFLERKVN